MALLLPGAIAMLASFAAAASHRRIRPSAAAPVLAFVSLTTTLAVVWSLVLLSLGFVAHIAWLTELAVWCRTVGLAHEAVPPLAGVAAIVLLLTMCVSLARRWRRLRGAPLELESSTDVVVVNLEAPLAYAVPGRQGHVVVSAGMLRALDDDERRVLLAHERAHLRHHHDRYTRVTELCASLVPLLAPLAARVRYATERWADEDAAECVGDRRLVARAVARAALVSTSHPVSALAFAGLGVPARVAALLEGDDGRGRSTITALLVTLVAVLAVAASTLQLHHLLAFVVELCDRGR